jgi:arylsulfatase A-like enzyme
MTSSSTTAKCICLIIGLMSAAFLGVVLVGHWGAPSRVEATPDAGNVDYSGRGSTASSSAKEASRFPAVDAERGGVSGRDGGVEDEGQSPSPKSNIVFVTVDTERADSTEIFNPSRPTTPFLAELAAGGITFTNAFSPAPWTAPAMYSIITGLYPSEHGIKNGVTVPIGPAMTITGQEELPDNAITLAERLKEIGYSTFGISTNLYMNSRFGFDQGFDHFVGGDFAVIPFPNLAVDSIAASVRQEQKWFVWLHYFDPHFPYITISPWFQKWNTSNFQSYMDVALEYVLENYREKQKKGPQDPVEARHVNLVYKFITHAFTNPDVLLSSLPEREEDSVRNDIDFFKAAYLSEIRHTDDAMREAFSSLGVDDQTLIIATSDHGEEFLDHGGVGHRQHESVYQELIHVPLVVCLPGRKGAGTRIDTPVSTLDIMPTLLELLGEQVPEGLSGKSLVPLILGRRMPARSIYSETKEYERETLALIEYPWKFIYFFSKSQGELYNLKSDPGEKKDLKVEEPDRASDMQDRLLGWRKQTAVRWRLKVPAPLTQAELNKLKRMGYIR